MLGEDILTTRGAIKVSHDNKYYFTEQIISLMKCCESRIKKSQPTAITFKRTFQCIFSTITSKRSTYNFEYLSVFHSCIDPDKKKIIPDPRNSSGSNRIRIYNTVLISNVTNLREKVEKETAIFWYKCLDFRSARLGAFIGSCSLSRSRTFITARAPA